MWNVSTPRCAIAVMAALLPAAFAGPSLAQASSLVYRDATYNVWITSPDGSVRKQVTHDATADGKHYSAPSQDDAGDILSYNLPDKFWGRIMNQDGADVRGPWLLQTPLCSMSPFESVINDTGKLIAVTYIDAGTSATSCLYPGTLTTKIVFGDVVTIGDPLPRYADIIGPRWIYRPAFVLGGINGDQAEVQTDTGMKPWIVLTSPSTADLDSFDVSRVADRVLLETSVDGFGSERRDLSLLEFTGTPPDGTLNTLCTFDGLVALSPSAALPRWSPDGTMIAWSGPEGVYVSPAPTVGAGGTCVLAPKLIAPGGSLADWGKADVATPPPPPASTPPPAATPGPAGQPAPAARRPLLTGARVSGATAKSGIALRVVLSGAATVSIRVERLPRRGKAKLLGTARLKARAGSSTLRIRKLAGKRLAKGRYRLTVSVPGSPARRLTLTVR